MIRCVHPRCSGRGVVTGTNGNLMWFRCDTCRMTWGRAKDEEPPAKKTTKRGSK